jgi:hypothetical protein
MAMTVATLIKIISYEDIDYRRRDIGTTLQVSNEEDDCGDNLENHNGDEDTSIDNTSELDASDAEPELPPVNGSDIDSELDASDRDAEPELDASDAELEDGNDSLEYADE